MSSAKKRDKLKDILKQDEVETAIIFCNRKTTVRELATSLRRSRFRVGEIHGDMDQSNRIAELNRFKDGDINILVASDVAARGLDIKGVSTVVNFDAPFHPDDYVHRIGRTGRAGATGTAYTLVTKADEENIDNIEKLTKQKIKRVGEGEVPAPEASTPEADVEPEDQPKPAKRSRAKKNDEAPRERRPRKEAASREDVPHRDEIPSRPAKSEEKKPRAKTKPRPEKLEEAAGDEDGWNGPLPSFLQNSAT